MSLEMASLITSILFLLLLLQITNKRHEFHTSNLMKTSAVLALRFSTSTVNEVTKHKEIPRISIEISHNNSSSMQIECANMALRNFPR